MFYEKDWFMREIKFAVRAAALLIFHREDVTYQVEDETRLTATDLIHRALLTMLAEGRICDAEDTLFESFLPGDRSHLSLALDFYQRLNELSDDYLEAHNFSRAEIHDGLRALMERSGLPSFGL